jgi:hypothetical protein
LKPEKLLKDYCRKECAKSKVFNTEVFEGLSQGVRARVSERLEVVENLRRIRTCEVVKGKRRTVKILRREFAKSRQPSDLIEMQGGYDCFQGSSLKDRESSDPHLDTHQLWDLTGVARGLNSHKQSEGLERHRDIGVSEFGVSEVSRTGDRITS